MTPIASWRRWPIALETYIQGLKDLTGPGTNSPYHFVKNDHLAIEQEFGEMMMNAVIEAKPKTIVEIGTGTGYSTAWLLLGTMAAGQGHVISYDHIERGSHFKAIGLPLTNLEIRRAEFPNVDDLPPSIDFLFHDSQHRYELIEPDLEKILPSMAPNSQIWIHDVLNELNRLLKIYFESRGWTYENVAVSCGMAIARKGDGK